jgi:uncharacterized protein with ParB-like and HNH nuclease domain
MGKILQMENKITSFRNIPAFVDKSYYNITVDWKYLPHTIERYQNEGDDTMAKLEMNPDFQRGHIWTESQQIAYVEYILRGGFSGRDIFFNCNGWMGSYKGPFVLVDGLQRVTAALKFMDSKLKAFGSYYNEYTDRIPTDASFNIHINNLKKREDVLTWYIQMNEGGTPHSQEEIAKVKKLLIESKNV